MVPRKPVEAAGCLLVDQGRPRSAPEEPREPAPAAEVVEKMSI